MFNCLPESVEALLCVGQVQRAGYGGELRMTKFNQVPRSLVRAFLIVSSDCVADPILGKAINAHDARAHLRRGLCLSSEIAKWGGDDDEAGRQVGAQFVEVSQLFCMIVVGVAENQP